MSRKTGKRFICFVFVITLLLTSAFTVCAYEPHTIFKLDPEVHIEYEAPKFSEEQLIPKKSVDQKNEEIKTQVYKYVDEFSNVKKSPDEYAQKHLNSALDLEVITEFDEKLDQRTIDRLNNPDSIYNINLDNIAENTEFEIESDLSLKRLNKETSDISARTASNASNDTIGFYAEPVNNPFDKSLGSNESVSLVTGGLKFSNRKVQRV